MDSLIIYKASAGSGKTFTLAVSYIKLLIASPHSYKSILAVTFTNKATEEMKLRILSQLYGIWKLLPESRSYLNIITSELDISEAYASSQAGIALSNLLHNYNYFKVETIDAFFQRILRNLARELDLTANLNIFLHDKQVEQQAVDELIESLKPDSKVLKWIMSYIQQNIDEDKSWNIIGQIKKFGENIFNDVYKSHYHSIHELLANEEAFDTYVKKIQHIQREAEKELQNIAEGFYLLLAKYGLEITDFSKGKLGVCGYFEKLQAGVYDEKRVLGKNVLTALEDPYSWVRKNEQVDGNTKLELVRSIFFPYLVEAETKRKKQLFLLRSAILTLKNLDKLRLLSIIEDKVRELNTEAGRFLLSDTQMLLHSLIKDNDSPFIFEKIGSTLEHIMIDEFQDTSTTQWYNFNVLLKECLSYSSSRSLIVGDVKQSIYRWRSGDWKLLNNIEDEFSSNVRFSVKNKTDNYRSERNIIDFNNAFFELAARFEYENFLELNSHEAQQISIAYSDVLQNVPFTKDACGKVELRLLSAEDAEKRIFDYVGETIDLLLSQGVLPKDIAILTRKNDYITKIADYLSETRPQLSLVSDEAFKLDASLAVHIIIDALTILLHPADNLTLASLVKSYQKYVLNNEILNDDFLVSGKTLSSYLPKEFWERREELLSLPIYSLVEFIYQTFQLDIFEEQSAYICAFYDNLGTFLTEKSSDLEMFLQEWEENIKTKNIQSDELNGVRLITIHKSKGLEFDHVIIPFCDWLLELSGNVLWCRPSVAPFNILPLIPITFYPKQMQGTIYEGDYVNEHLQNIVDNLNLLYVAFTRAAKNLFIFAQKGNSSRRSFVIEQILKQVHYKLENSNYITPEDNEYGDTLFTYGSLYVPLEKKTECITHNVFMESPTSIKIGIKVSLGKVSFLQSNQSKEFLTGSEEKVIDNKEYISLGRILHQVFAKIHTISDIDRVLKELEFNGLLYDNQITFERLTQLLYTRLTDPRVAEWFSPKWKVFNECSILTLNSETNMIVEQRPDRVLIGDTEVIVIDFKFGNPQEHYKQQVSLYMSLLTSMGYTNVRGYLWFIYSNNIVEVK